MVPEMEPDTQKGVLTMRVNRTYHVKYRMYSADSEHGIDVLASSKADAYDKAVYDVLPEVPYSAWVYSVTYDNGYYKRFNTFEGNPY